MTTAGYPKELISAEPGQDCICYPQVQFHWHLVQGKQMIQWRDLLIHSA